MVPQNRSFFCVLEFFRSVYYIEMIKEVMRMAAEKRSIPVNENLEEQCEHGRFSYDCFRG